MKYTKIIISSLFVAVLAYAVAVSPAFALTTSDNDSTAGISAPATSNNGDTSSPSTSNSGDTSAPATSNNGDTSAPSTNDNGTTADSSAPRTVDNGNTSSPSTTDNGNTSAPSTNDNGTTADSSAPRTVDNGDTSALSVSTPSNNGGGRGGSSNRNRNTTLVATPIINGANCTYLTSYLNFDGNNDASEVTKLQTFLKNNEKLNVDINGKFDQKTLDAVKAFQAKYVADTMAPWGVTTPTGQVFYTTKNKINELVCNSKLALSASQLSTIESYKSNVSNGTVNTISETATGTDSLSPVVGSNDNSQTASAAGTSFAGKIWKFVKWIFGY